MDGDLDGFDRQLGDRLKALRTRRGLSLADVASEIGISYQQLQKHEAGRNSLTIHRLLRIANALEVDPQTILEVLTSPDGQGELSRFLPLQRLGERHRLLKAYFALPEEIRSAFLNLIEGTADTGGLDAAAHARLGLLWSTSRHSGSSQHSNS